MKRRFNRLIIFGSIYLLIGVSTALISNPLKDSNMQVFWRLASLVISIIVFVVHIRMEVIRFDYSPKLAAVNASIAVALGTFTVALLANINAWVTSSANNMLLLALLLWPIITGIISFTAAWFIAFLVNRTRSKS